MEYKKIAKANILTYAMVHLDQHIWVLHITQMKSW